MSANLYFSNHRATGNRLRQAVHISVLLEKIRNAMTITKNDQALENAEKLIQQRLSACAKSKDQDISGLISLIHFLNQIVDNANEETTRRGTGGCID